MVEFARNLEELKVSWEGQMDQVKRCRVEDCSLSGKCMVSLVYGENSHVRHSKLWATLTSFSATTKGNPWLIMGDFNAVCKSNEWAGGGGVGLTGWMTSITSPRKWRWMT